jgi:hypothetical protein
MDLGSFVQKIILQILIEALDLQSGTLVYADLVMCLLGIMCLDIYLLGKFEILNFQRP